jgi:hypothetical protein
MWGSDSGAAEYSAFSGFLFCRPGKSFRSSEYSKCHHLQGPAVKEILYTRILYFHFHPNRLVLNILVFWISTVKSISSKTIIFKNLLEGKWKFSKIKIHNTHKVRNRRRIFNTTVYIDSQFRNIGVTTETRDIETFERPKMGNYELLHVYIQRLILQLEYLINLQTPCSIPILIIFALEILRNQKHHWKMINIYWI